VIAADGFAFRPDRPADAIIVNAGVTHLSSVWLDTLSAEGGRLLLVLAETKDAGKREAWAKRGAAFFQSRSRRNAPTTERNTDGAPAQPSGAQPAPSRKGAT
jgi:protein-L-isoaspartate O-methyltransferase